MSAVTVCLSLPGATIVPVSPAAAATRAIRLAQQPSNQAVNAGQTATFTAVASGSPPPTVRWMSEPPGATAFTPISGALSSTLQVVAVTKEMSGTRYEAIFTNRAGSVTTSPAILVVGHYVELFFSRTEVTAWDGPSCMTGRRDDTGVALLRKTVAPYLHSLGLSATGSIETGPTQPTAFWCTHFGETLATSWAVAQQLAATYRWTFVTHSLDYPILAEWESLTPGQLWDETCGAAQTIDAEGLPGADNVYFWPNNAVYPPATSFVARCFGTNRVDNRNGVTTSTQLSTPPYEQSVEGISGGFCASTTAPCHNVPGTITSYTSPDSIISEIKGLQPGQVLALQVYLLVTGKSPLYTSNRDRWDCTSSPTLHWTNDAERYCWSDFQKILKYLATNGGITQPLTVNAAFGRTGYSDTAVPRPPG